MATNQNIKDALTFAADSGNPILQVGRTVGNVQLQRFSDALAGTYNLGGVSADDAARWLWRQAAGFIKRYERAIAVDAIPQPTDFDE